MFTVRIKEEDTFISVIQFLNEKKGMFLNAKKLLFVDSVVDVVVIVVIFNRYFTAYTRNNNNKQFFLSVLKFRRLNFQ